MSPLTTVWEAEAGRSVRMVSTLVLEALGRKLHKRVSQFRQVKNYIYF